MLPHDHRGDRPAVVEIDFQRRARANGVGGVVVVPDEAGVVGGDPRRRIRARSEHVVDVAGVVFLPANQADRRALGNRRIDEAVEGMPDAAAIYSVGLDGIARGKPGRIGLVGDDADGAGLGTGAVQRALRPGQRFDALDVVDVDVERALDRSDRLLVQVHADAGLRAGMVAIATAGDTPHVDLCESRP